MGLPFGKTIGCPIAATAGKNICSSRGIRPILRAFCEGWESRPEHELDFLRDQQSEAWLNQQHVIVELETRAELAELDEELAQDHSTR